MLLGETIDTNSAHMARAISELGINIFQKTSIGDNLLRIKKALEEALSRADLIIISGGIGPTEDDVTREAVSEFFKKKLVLDKNILQRIKKKYARHKIPGQAILKQSMVPTSAKIITNPVGSAPGIIIEEKGKIVILLPGVPQELKAMLPELIQYLKTKSHSQIVIKSRTLKIWGLGESQVNEKIAILMSKVNPTVALLVKKGEVHIRITARFILQEACRQIQNMERVIREKLGDYIFGTDEETLEEIVSKLLIKKNLTISIAESCSGGLVANRLTNTPGISASLLCAVVSYSNKAKSEILKVSPRLIKDKGAVSPEVAQEMAKGIKALTNSDISVGITGIAGPGGATPKKPVGLVYIALNTKEEKICQKHHFSGSRNIIKWKSSQAAFYLLRKYLLGKLNLKNQQRE